MKSYRSSAVRAQSGKKIWLNQVCDITIIMISETHIDIEGDSSSISICVSLEKIPSLVTVITCITIIIHRNRQIVIIYMNHRQIRLAVQHEQWPAVIGRAAWKARQDHVYIDILRRLNLNNVDERYIIKIIYQSVAADRNRFR